MKTPKKSSGFTLIEAIVATTLTVTIALSVLSLFINSIVVNTETKKRQIALKSAEGKIEEYRTKSFTDIVSAQPDPETNPAETFSVSLIPSGNGNVYIYDYAEAPDDLKELKVNVSWSGKGGQMQSIDLTTIVGEHGLNDQ